METTYMIQGGDGKQYGPATLAQLQEWIAGGRVGPLTHILRSDQSAWQPAQNFSELSFQPAPPPAAVPPIAAAPLPNPAGPELLALEARIKSGASWFYWIAGLSLINSIMAITGSGFGFVVGLGITQVFDAIGKEVGSAGPAVAMALDVMAAGVLVLFGVFANKRQPWAFIVGMILYAIDGLIFLLAGDWLALGFHAFALFCIFAGFQALQKHRQLACPTT